jgi:hypothetical protein
MACPDFEELVRDGPGGHAAHCEECRALLDAAADVDAAFEDAFAGISAPPGLTASVRARISMEEARHRPSLVPELLDLIGWAAVLALVAALSPRFMPLLEAALSKLS